MPVEGAQGYVVAHSVHAGSTVSVPGHLSGLGSSDSLGCDLDSGHLVLSVGDHGRRSSDLCLGQWVLGSGTSAVHRICTAHA